MNKKLIVVLALSVAACRVNENKQVEPTAETQTATAAAVEQTRETLGDAKDAAREVGKSVQEGAEQIRESDAGQRIAAGATEAARGVKQGVGEAAEAAGDAIAREGREAQAEVKPGAPQTTTTTTTVTTTVATSTRKQ